MSETSPSTFLAGLVQMCSGRDVGRNVADALALIAEASDRGARYVQTPECTTLMELEPARLMAETKPEAGNRSLDAFQKAARDHGIWLHIGSMGIKVGERRLANRAYLITPNGDIAARYDKIHMFDVDLGGGESYSESANYAAGEAAVVSKLPWGILGLTICYDVRFPQLHRALAKAGAIYLSSPAAFTKTTGQAHWHKLLQARAIETQSFVFAAGQCGRHENGRETFGHSLIVSPWGEILSDGGQEIGVTVADIDPRQVADIRRKIPSLGHDRAFEVVVADAKAPSFAGREP